MSVAGPGVIRTGVWWPWSVTVPWRRWWWCGFWTGWFAYESALLGGQGFVLSANYLVRRGAVPQDLQVPRMSKPRKCDVNSERNRSTAGSEPSRGVIGLLCVQDWLPEREPRKGDMADRGQLAEGPNTPGERRWVLG